VTWLQRGVPVFGAEIERGTAVDVGDLVLVDVPTLVDGDGTRGVSGLLCSILERGETTRNGKQAVTLLALGHGLKLRLGAWSPTAEVSAYAAGVATVGTLFTGTDDAAPFTAGQAVFLLDANGTRIDTDAPPATVTGVGPLQLKVTFATATPAATDLIVLAQYDDVAIRDVYAWQADPAGTLGAGLEAAFTWG
jgi:subtilisin family serine protease